jgi:hypothetical protein
MVRSSKSQGFQRNGVPTILATLALFVGAQAFTATPASALLTDTCSDAHNNATTCQDPAAGGPADGGATEDRDWDKVTDGTQEGNAAKGTGGDAYGGDSYGEESVASSDSTRTDTASAPAIGPQNPTSETWTHWTGTGLGDYKDIQVSTDWKSWTATNVMCPTLLSEVSALTDQINRELDAIDQWNESDRWNEAFPDGVNQQRRRELHRQTVKQIRSDAKEDSRKRAQAKIQWRYWDCESALGAVRD